MEICIEDKDFSDVGADSRAGNKYKQIGFPANVTLKEDGVLDGKLQQGFFPIASNHWKWLYLVQISANSLSSDGFNELKTLISNQTSLIDFKFYSESANLRSLSDCAGVFS